MFYFVFILSVIIVIQNASPAVPSGYLNMDARKPEIVEEIVKIIPKKDTITFTVVPRGIILSVAQTELFDGNSDKISNCGKVLLAKIANLLRMFDNKCTIEAHTEEYIKNNKIYKEDWEISIVRANAIAAYMVHELSVESERIFPVGFGKIMPFRENVAPINFPDNRIDFVIFDYAVHR